MAAKAKAIASDGGSKSLCFLCSTCPAKAGQVPLCSAPLVPIAKNLPHTEQAEPKNGRFCGRGFYSYLKLNNYLYISIVLCFCCSNRMNRLFDLFGNAVQNKNRAFWGVRFVLNTKTA